MRKKNVLYRLFFNKNDERAYGRFAFFFDNLMQSFSDLFAKGSVLRSSEARLWLRLYS